MPNTYNKKPVEKSYLITCSLDGATDGQAILFQRDGRNFYVPLNEPVSVPKWVYDIWVESSWNIKNRNKGLDPEHLVKD